MKSPEGELKLNEKFDYERLKLDYKLKEADNRFLQEELENKNKMLAMLTEGLKEVSKCVHLTMFQSMMHTNNRLLNALFICLLLK